VPASAATVESLGQQLREVLPSRRLHSVSLCDHEANVLWLSEGALGPDEHAVVVEALEALAGDPALPCHETALEDGRLAVFLPVRAPTGALVGIAMILADSKSVGDDTLERLTAMPVRTIMQRLAVLLKPAAPAAAARHDPIPIELALEPEVQAPPVAAATPPEAVTPLRQAAAHAARPGPVPAKSAASKDAAPKAAGQKPAAAPAAEPPVISPEEINDILEFELAPHEALTTSVAALNLDADETPPMAVLEFLPEPPVVNPIPAPTPARGAARVASAAPAAAPVLRKARVLDPPMPARKPPEARPAPAAAAPATRAPTPPPAVAEARTADAPVADDGVILELLPFAKLRAGGQTRRFQLQARTVQLQRDPATLDALALQRLLGWLAQHRASWNAQPTSFTVNLSIATLEDERFVQKLAPQLNAHGIAAETLGFEIAEALCVQRRAPVERFIAHCEKVGAWVAIDDFSFDAQVLPLLRFKALRLVKLDAKLTAAALRDKLSQALVVATVQAAKVLGIHCAAKKVDSKASLQWLTAIGCDFAQGSALGPVQPLESLGTAPTAPAQDG
jgi:EAL domain-containing protein (putative c-di-GMP-specific phosphodiesterase class I)